MKILKEIGFIMTILGFLAFIISVRITGDLQKLDILNFSIMLLGCILQVYPQYKTLKEYKTFNAQGSKYFFGIIIGILFFSGILVFLIKEFY